MKTDDNGNKRLVGYVVANSDFDKERVVLRLKEKLPEYMIPTFFIELESLPLTDNGKVDKKALPDPDAAALLTTAYVAPRNETEQELANIWQELLGVQRVGVYDNFFELGGDSITTIQVSSRARRAGISLQPRDLFVNYTISSLSALLAMQVVSTAQAAQEFLTVSSGLLPVQQHFFEADTKDFSHYNQHLLLKVDKQVSHEKLAFAINELVKYHDALRFTYNTKQEQTEQVYGNYEVLLETADFSGSAEDLEVITADYQQGLNLEQGILMRSVFLQTPENESHHRLLLVIHHLAVDGVSWRILLDDLSLLLEQQEAKTLKEITGDKTSAYYQWYNALAVYGQKQRLLNQLPYWENAVQQYIPLRTNKDTLSIANTADTGTFKASLNKKHTKQLLQEVSQAYYTEVNDILLSALAITLADWNDHTVVSVGLEGHGREDISAQIDTSHTTGWFTSLYPVLLEVKKDTDTGSILKNIKEQLRQVPEKGIGFGVLNISISQLFANRDPWDVVFNYLGKLDHNINDDAVINPLWETFALSVSADYPLREKIAVNAMIRQGVLEIQWDYSTLHFNKKSVKELAMAFVSALEEIITHCVAQTASSHTPADYELGEVITVAELDEFLVETVNGSPRKDQIEGLARLSGLQEGMLFHGLYDGQAGTYIQQFYCTLENLDENKFVKSWQNLISQHSILRSGFYHDVFSVPVQCIYKEAEMPVTLLDYRHLSKTEQENAIREFEASDRLQGFDFTVLPLMRLCLIQLHDNYYHMIWSYHHILLDGWSLPVILEELLRAYESQVTETALTVLLNARYDDYIRYIYRRDKDKASNYWRKYMEGVNEGTLLSFISVAADRNKGKGVYEKEKLHLDSAFTASLMQFTHRNHITLNTLMQGVWAYLLHRYTGKNAVTYGVIVSGRPEDLPGVERGVGMYINTLPLHTAVDEDQSLTGWLQALQMNQLESREHQYTTLNEIQRLSEISGDIFDSLLVFENYPVSKVLNEQPWALRLENIGLHEHTNYPFNIVILATDTIQIDFGYNASLLSPEYAASVSAHFEQVLQQFMAVGQGLLSTVEILSESERSLLLDVFNDSSDQYLQPSLTIIDAFNEQVVLTPENTAIVYGSVSLTYRELDKRSEQLAHALINKGLLPGALVPVASKRSMNMMVGILAILKAGAAYVPIDPDYPQERILFMLEDTAGKIAITDSEWLSLFTGLAPDLEFVCLDKLELSAVENTVQADTITADSPAYVIYTSGSTGQPKGVLVTQRNVVSLVKDISYVELNEHDVLLSTGSPSFDATTFEYWGMLLNGGKLILCPDDSLLDSGLLKEQIRLHKVTKMWFTSSWFNQLIDTDISVFEGLSVVLAGGEKLSDEHVFKIRKTYPELTVINGYGPTENTTFSLTFTIDDRGSIPIGKPLDGRTAYILDAQLRLLPAGVPGEIYLGGAGLSLGYLNRPDLTAERFINHPFNKGEKIYKTGDVGRWLPDGNIEYQGRIDDQVKIRGYRIELGEIENVLQQSELVNQAVVVVKEENGAKRLVGYVVPEGEFDRDRLVVFLKSRLPEYMIPALWVELDKLPLTNNGKVDKKALPDADTGSLFTGNYEAPRNAMEEGLATIWQDLLRIPRVGIHDNFFELGGDSIITIQVVSRAKRMGYNLHPRDLFICQTIAVLAAVLVKSEAEAGSISEQGVLTGHSGLLPIQQWFFEIAGQTESHFNQHVLLTIDKNIAQDTIEEAVRALVQYHDALRFTYRSNGDELIQEYGTYEGQLGVADLKVVMPDKLQEAVLLTAEQYQRSLDIEKGILLRAVLILTPEEVQQHRLLIIVHHLAVDGVSWRVLVEDLQLLLENSTDQSIENRGKSVEKVLGKKSSSVRQWYDALTVYSKNSDLTGQLSYWEKTVQQAGRLKTDFDYPGLVNYGDTTSQVLKLNSTQTRRLLQEVPKAYHTEINDILLSALAMTLAEWNGHQTVTIKMEGHGREDIATDIDTSRTIGWFTSLYPVSLEVSPDLPAGDMVKSVKEQLRQIPGKGLGYGILKYISKEPSLQHPNGDIVFNYLGQMNNMLDGNGILGTAEEEAGTSVGHGFLMPDNYISIVLSKMMNWKSTGDTVITISHQPVSSIYQRLLSLTWKR